MTPACVIGLDIGGTKIAGGWIRFPDAERGAARIIPTRATRGARAILDDVLALTRALANEVREAGHRLDALGVGICELVDRNGRLASAHSIPWLDRPVRVELETLAPTVFEADVRAAARAEARFGAGRSYDNFLYVTVGTGISCCLVTEGEPYLGSQGLTGTMASSPLALPCEACGQTSGRTLEEIAAGPGLAARFSAAGGTGRSGEDVFDAVKTGDAVAQRIVVSAAEALGSQLAVLVGTLDPEAVVVGGGIGLSDGAYWDCMHASMRRYIWSAHQRELPILQAQTGADAGWLGAAIRAAQSFRSTKHPM